MEFSLASIPVEVERQLSSQSYYDLEHDVDYPPFQYICIYWIEYCNLQLLRFIGQTLFNQNIDINDDIIISELLKNIYNL